MFIFVKLQKGVFSFTDRWFLGRTHKRNRVGLDILPRGQGTALSRERAAESENRNLFELTIDNEQLTMKESPAGMIEKDCEIESNSSRMDTTIVNCQLSIVNSITPNFSTSTN